MEKVFLRVYNREIENMIEGGQLDEAVAHCQHILRTFPMHVETYRLLGKAFLEARRYADAADIFQRVLMAVPDDFVSNVGMSIIRDDEGKLDDAIWHMERAFEVQPSNSAIQGELRRLYGRRDGVEPSKIRLSRDALANMYSQGELFNQAIAEIRSVLADDPDRPDLQVMLMRVYYRSGQKVEAAEIATTLLRKYPYCLDSLRVLVDVLPGTAREENMQVYRHRLYLLDPYSSQAKESVFSSAQVVDSAVSLERLDYKPGSMPGSPQPDWAASLGIKLNTDKRSEQTPDWMQPSAINETPNAPQSLPISSPGTPVPQNKADDIPDWMRSAGWVDSTGETTDSTQGVQENPPDAPIAKADIPDWLMSMAPADANASANLEDDQPENDLLAEDAEFPDWLKPLPSAEGADAINQKAPDASSKIMEVGEQTDLPDETPAENSMISPGSDESISAGDTSLPDWLGPTSSSDTPSEPHPESIEFTPESSGDVQNWLKSTPASEISSDTSSESQASEEVHPAEDSDVPSWLMDMPTAETVEETLKEPPGPTEARDEAKEEIPDWLKSLTPEENIPSSAQAAQAPVDPHPAAEEDIPDWLKSMSPAGTTGQTVQPSDETAGPAPEVNENIPDWLKGMGPASTGDETSSTASTGAEAQPAMDADIPEWLKAMSPEEPAEQIPAEPPVHQEIGSSGNENIPDWLSSTGPAEPPVDLNSEAGSSLSVSPESGSQQPGLPIDNPSTADEALPDWLQGLGTGAEEALPSPSDQYVEPDSGDKAEAERSLPLEPTISATDEAASARPVISAESFQPSGEVKPLNIEDDALGWLESLAAKQGAKPEELLTKPQDRSTDMPDWLRQVDENPAEEPAANLAQPVLNPSGSSAIEPPDSAISSPASGKYATDSEVAPEVPAAVPADLPAEKAAQVSVPAEPTNEDTMAWLESLSSGQNNASEEMLTSPDEGQGDNSQPEQQAVEEQPVEFNPEEPAPVSSEPVKDEDLTITSWLNKKDVEEALGKVPIEQPAEEKPADQMEDLPDWLKTLEPPVVSEITPGASNDLPEWLRQTIPTEETEVTSNAESPVWVDENAPATGQSVPTQPEEWIPAEPKAQKPEEIAVDTGSGDLNAAPLQEAGPGSIGASAPEGGLETPAAPQASERIEPTQVPVPVSVQHMIHSPTLKQTGMLSAIPVKDKDAELLSSAQMVLDQDSLDESMKIYMKLIKKGRLLDEVIHDLREAIYRYPVDVVIWQTLGDAYMRANRLQDALDAYTKAEELLR
jgi:tetratricopeptide (TPR) repeat protein